MSQYYVWTDSNKVVNIIMKLYIKHILKLIETIHKWTMIKLKLHKTL